MYEVKQSAIKLKSSSFRLGSDEDYESAEASAEVSREAETTTMHY